MSSIAPIFSTPHGWLDVLAIAADKHSILGADVMSTTGLIYPRTGVVANLRPETEECDIAGRRVSLSHLVRIRLPDGRVIESPAVLALHKQIMREREEERQLVQRVQEETSYIPACAQGNVNLLAEVAATVGGLPKMAYAFVRPQNVHIVVLLARSKKDAQRAMGLLLSDFLYWDAVGVLVKAHLLWVHWHLLRAHCAETAARIRRSQPFLDAHDSYERKDERTALYDQFGLNEERYGAWVSTECMETYDPDWETIFAWFDAKPTPLLTQFLTKAWDSRRFIEEPDDDLNTETLDAFILNGFAERETTQKRPPQEMLSDVNAGQLREWIKEAGSTFKSRSTQALRDHLLELAPSFIEERLLARQPIPRVRFLTPPGLSWRQFQNFRQNYRNMIETMLYWLHSGNIAPEADKFYRFSSKVSK